jgi:thiol:disulfide interchange protein DsbD
MAGAEAIPYFGLMTYGHHGRFVLLQDLVLPGTDHRSPLPHPPRCDWLVCADICIPENGGLPSTFRPARRPARPTGDPWPDRDGSGSPPGPSPWATHFNADGETLRLRTALDAPIAHLSEARSSPTSRASSTRWPTSLAERCRRLTLDLALDWPEGLAQPLEGVLVLTESLPDGELRQAFTIAAPRTRPSP